MSKYTQAIDDLCEASRDLHRRVAEARAEIEEFEKEMNEAGINFEIRHSGILKWARPVGKLFDFTVMVLLGSGDWKPWRECPMEMWPGVASSLMEVVLTGTSERKRVVEWKP